MGVDKDKNDLGLCGELAVIRCNACKEYFCEECWAEHLEMTVVIAQGSLTEQIEGEGTA